MTMKVGRRTFMKSSVAASIAAVNLQARPAAASMPTGKIGNVEISRLICGSNPFYGGAHSRDLIYVGNLLRHYCTQEKIFDTLELCERNGINTMIEGESLSVRYRKASACRSCNPRSSPPLGIGGTFWGAVRGELHSG